MKAIMLLITLLSACTIPTSSVTTQKSSSQMECFAPPGLYQTTAVLRRHECKTAPKEMIAGEVGRIESGSLKCGLFRTWEVVEGRPTVLVFLVNERGMAGSMTIFFPDCRATYKIEFLRTKP